MLKAHKLPVGDTVGHWRILERIGRGAVASVYRARDVTWGHDVALKVLHADPHEEETRSVDRLQREIKLAQRIDDPAVCKIFELETIDEVLFLVMEFIPGRSLRDILEEDRRLAPARAARIAHDVAEGLAAAHDQEILHRDLKPGNVMVRPDDTAAILDFGYAIAPDVTRVTKKGSWVGTLAYAAPELLKNQPATKASDVYSLGVLLYECLTGEMPFVGHNYGELASAILFRDVVPPSRLVPDLHPTLDRIVLEAMTREAAERPSRAERLALAIAEVLPELRESNEPTVTAVEVPADGAEEREESTAVTLPPPVSKETTAVDIPTPEAPAPIGNQMTEVEPSPLFETTEPRGRALETPSETTVPTARRAFAPSTDATDPSAAVLSSERPARPTVPVAPTPEPTETTEPAATEPTEPRGRRTEPTEPAATREPTEPRGRPETTEPEGRVPEVPTIPTPQAAHDRLAVHKKLADLSAALVRERQTKGVIQGDSPDLDGLEKTAQEALREGDWSRTIDHLERALEKAQNIEVDPRFVVAKIDRFEAAIAEKAQPHNQAHFRGLLQRARSALEHGDVGSANQTLNHAFDTLRAK